jgi:hypothetical protein
MPLYITRDNILFNDRPMVPRGALVLPGEMSVGKLKRSGKVAEIVFEDEPQLADVEGWTSRARKLAALGYTDVLAVLMEADDVLMRKAKVTAPTAKRWKEELRTYLANLVNATAGG